MPTAYESFFEKSTVVYRGGKISMTQMSFLDLDNYAGEFDGLIEFDDVVTEHEDSVDVEISDYYNDEFISFC